MRQSEEANAVVVMAGRHSVGGHWKERALLELEDTGHLWTVIAPATLGGPGLGARACCLECTSRCNLRPHQTGHSCCWPIAGIMTWACSDT